MKSLILFLVFGTLSHIAIGQTSIIDIDSSDFIEHILLKPKAILATPAVSEERDFFNIIDEHWDNNNFFTYQNTHTSYPFKISFTDTTYASPINNTKVITSRFGWRRGRPHNGIDIDLQTGDTVYSVLSGIVRYAKYSKGHGNTVVVRHYNGLETVYAHLSSIAVKANDTVSKGQYIGKGGNSGRSRGSHLHFGTMFKGEYIHPEYLLDFSETNKITAKELWITQQWTQARYHKSTRKSKLELFATKEEALASLIKTKKIYVVQHGDTLSRISQHNNVSISAICKTNAIKMSSTLRVGQKLILEI